MGTIQSKQASERRHRTREMIDKWLDERQQMLVVFCQLAGLEPYSPDKPVKQLLRDFCQVLMDYTAFGHFEVLDRITRGEERRSSVVAVAERLYPQVAEITDVAVTFNDKYDTSDHDQSMGHLDEDLSRLGEVLAVRIEMEDKLVNALLN